MIASMKSGLVLTLLLVLAATVKAQEKLTAEDILQRHLGSVGTAAIRSAAKSRVVEASASDRILLGANPAPYDGKAVIVSEGNKLQCCSRSTLHNILASVSKGMATGQVSKQRM